MPYEVTFNRKPNRGETKKFTMLGKKQKEVNVEIDGTETEAATSSKPTTSAAAALDTFTDDEMPIARVVDRLRSQTAANANRDILNSNKVTNGDKMIAKHDHKRNKVTRTFKVADLVTVKIPRIDRAGSDFKRMPGIVCKVKTHGDYLHHLITAYGTLNDWYRTGDLEPLVGGVSDAVIENYEKKMISLTEAAKLQGACTGSVIAVNAMCNCNTGCQQDKRCTCFQNGLKCTSHCHAKLVTGKNKQKVLKKSA